LPFSCLPPGANSYILKFLEMKGEHVRAIIAGVAMFVCLVAPTVAMAEPTDITVRVLGRDATFVGSGTGGVAITITDLESGEILASGITQGTAGDGRLAIGKPLHRGQSLATDDSAFFTATLDIDHPTKIRLEARGPLGRPEAENTVTATHWIIPGRHITPGDGWVLEMPGLILELVSPRADKFNVSLPHIMDLSVHITPMCGCGIKPQGYWPPENYQVSALLKRNGETVSEQPLEFSGQPSLFNGSVKIAEAGRYELLIWAFDSSNANAGVASSRFEVFGND